MNIEKILDYAKAKEGAEYEYKAAWNADIIKIRGKMFAFAGEDKNGQKIINLKNEPNENLALRVAYPKFVTAGYYSNKAHWNSWFYDKDDMDFELLKEQIDISYALVLGKR